MAKFIAFVEQLGIDVAACMKDVAQESTGFSDADGQAMQEPEQIEPFDID